MPDLRQPTQAEYRTLAEFRYLVRCFLAFSEAAARGKGLTVRQHQALLAIKGLSRDEGPTIGDLAKWLLIRPHSAGELVGRLVAVGLVRRLHDADDRRRVRLGLTAAAEDRLARLAATHLEELRRLRPALRQILDQVDENASR